MSFVRNFVLLFVLFLVALPATASAQVWIGGVETVEGDDAVSRALTTALRASARASGWTISPNEGNMTQLSIAASCSPPERSCLDSIASLIGVSSIVFGRMIRIPLDNPSEFDLEVQLYHFARLEGEIISRYTGRVGSRASDEALAGFADVAIAQLLPPVPAPVAAVVPVDEDEASPHVDPTAEILEPSPETPSSSFDLEYIGWPLIGLAAASFATALGLAGVLDSYNNDPAYQGYRSSVPTTERDVCTSAASGMLYEPASPEAMNRLDRARSICSSAPALEITQVVLYIVSGLSAAAGGALIGYDLSISPSVSADHAYLELRHAF